MSIRLIKSVAETEKADDLHLVRLLLLLREADLKSGKTIAGIMKLAKLDFLLRYPNCLERVLVEKGKKTERANIQNYERTSIESKMIRFRYGPWDKRYRRWIGILIAKGLVVSYKKGKTIHVGLTDQGRSLSEELLQEESFQDLAIRSNEIIKTVGSMSATGLKDFIYKVFPEIISLKWGEDIHI